MTKSKRQKVQRLLKLFSNGHEVHINGAKAAKVQVSEAAGRSENQVLYLEWLERNESFSIKITEQSLADARISETAIELEDDEGDPIRLRFHQPNGIPPIAT